MKVLYIITMKLKISYLSLYVSFSVHLIASVPGRHTSDVKNAFGHLKLRKAGLFDIISFVIHCCVMSVFLFSMIFSFSLI